MSPGEEKSSPLMHFYFTISFHCLFISLHRVLIDKFNYYPVSLVPSPLLGGAGGGPRRSVA